MQHVLLVSPTSGLPTVISQNSHAYPELIQSGYQAIQFGTKRELTEIESEMMADYVEELELNQFN